MSFTASNSCTGISRRQLLRRGIAGSVLLGTASLTASLSGCASTSKQTALNPSPTTAYRFLNRQDLVLLAALAPAIVDRHWPETPAMRVAAMNNLSGRVDRFIVRMGDHNIREMRKLFDLLNSGLMKGLTTGIWSDWDEADNKDIQRFLNDWKHSRFALFNSAYNALSDIIGFAWYSDPTHTKGLGYAGPPAHAIESLPQFQNMSPTAEGRS